MAELLGHVAELGDWRSVVLAEKLLPLSHFTSFTVLTSKLCRAKGELSKSVGYLLRQVSGKQASCFACLSALQKAFSQA